LDAIWYFYDLRTNIHHISFETGRLDSIPILLFIVKKFGLEDFIFEVDGNHILVCLFEKVSTGRGKVHKVKVKEPTNQKEKTQGPYLKNFNDTIVTFIFTNNSTIDLVDLAGNKSKCSHTSKLLINTSW